jgi:anthranilate phosphoribosyltransferase
MHIEAFSGQVAKNVQIGVSALEGVKGAAYDRVVLNAAIADHLLGCDGASDVQVAIERAKEAIDSGRALGHLKNYIKASHSVQ